MTDDERRSLSWQQAIHAEATRTVFEKRAARLRKFVRVRDFLGLAVPIIVAFLFTGDTFHVLKENRELIVAGLGIAALSQALVVPWSLISRWDESLTTVGRSARDAYDMGQKWRRLGENDSHALAVEFDLLRRQQEVIDSHDVELNITKKEERSGMRAALIAFDKACVCGQKPSSDRPPFRKTHPCNVCGGN